MRFGDLTYEEIREAAAAGDLVVVPTGCTEQQGPHLTVDFDTWFADSLCLAAADRALEEHGTNVLVLPALPFGPTSEHKSFGSGYIHVPTALHREILRSIFQSVVEQGFSRILIWRGCGGHDLQSLVDSFNCEQAGRAHAFLPPQPFHEVWSEIGNPAVPGGHADSFATSIALYLRPACVRQSKIFDPNSGHVDWTDPELDFAEYSCSGVIGDPTLASADLGKRLWKRLVEIVAATFAEAAVTTAD